MNLDELRSLIGKRGTLISGEPLTETHVPKGEPLSYSRLILAGGLASRLGAGVPKALLEIEGRPLIDYFLDDDIPTFIMTAPEHLKAIQAKAPSAYCFAQDRLPLLEAESLAPLKKAPCGNGDALAAMDRSRVLDKLQTERLIVLPVDNPLGLFAEDSLCKMRGDVGMGVVRREENELAGGVISLFGQARVVEYLHSNTRTPFVNTGIYSFATDFVRRVCKEPLPLHAVEKIEEGERVWKFEKFLFDIFAFAKEVYAVELNRERSFSPIKTPLDLATFQSAKNLLT